MKTTEYYNAASACGRPGRCPWTARLVAGLLFMISGAGYCGSVTIKTPDEIVLQHPSFSVFYRVPKGTLSVNAAYQPIQITVEGKRVSLDDFICNVPSGTESVFVSQNANGVNLSIHQDRIELKPVLNCSSKKDLSLPAGTTGVMTVQTGTSINGTDNGSGVAKTFYITDVVIYDYLNKAVSTYNNGVSTASTKSMAYTKTGSGITATYVDSIKQQQIAGGGASTKKLMNIVTNNWGRGAAYGLSIRTPTGPLGTYTKPLVQGKQVPWDQQQVLTANSKVELQISNVPAGTSVAGEIVVELAMM